MKNEKNRTFFKEKTQADSRSIRQVFDDEKQDLAIFHAKTSFYFHKFLKFKLCYKGQARPISFLI